LTNSDTSNNTIQEILSQLKTKDKYFLDSLAKTIIRSYFANGDLSDDLKLSQNDFIQKIQQLTNKSNFQFLTIDHRDSILQKAYDFFEAKEYNLGKVFFAMFFEHSLNSIIDHECFKRKISEKVKIEIIKSVDMNGKLTWLLQLLGLPAFNDNHRKTIKKIADDRNAFIHYKWKAVDMDERKQETDELKKIKLALRYMKKYETNILFRNKKQKLERKLKSK